MIGVFRVQIHFHNLLISDFSTNASATGQLYTFKLVVKGRENQGGGKESLMLIARHLSP